MIVTAFAFIFYNSNQPAHELAFASSSESDKIPLDFNICRYRVRLDRLHQRKKRTTHLLEFAILMHAQKNIASADKLAVDVDLRNRRPRSVSHA
jgi:hypothetical protein